MLKRISLIVLLSALGGCAATITVIPDKIGERGLLVGQVISETVLPGHLDPVIDGQKRIGGVRSGHIVVALAPGEHSLDFLETDTTVKTYGAYSTSSSTRFPVKRTFQIQAGKATNIGAVVLLANREVPRVAFRTFAVDNSSEMSSFLRVVHPSLWDSLQKPMLLAPGDYLKPQEVTALRRELALRKVATAEWRRSAERDAAYVAGPIGSVVKVERDAQNRITALQPLDTQTFENLSDCIPVGKRAACLLSESSFLLVDEDRVVRRNAPPGVTANSVHALKAKGVALIDDSMVVYTSRDNGVTWESYEGGKRGKAVESARRRAFGIAHGKSGYYIFSKLMDAKETKLLYADYSTYQYQKEDLPPSAEELWIVRDTAMGLVVGPAYTHFGNAKLHVKPAGKAAFEVRSVPDVECADLAFDDSTGLNMRALCHRIVWTTGDGGVTWRKTGMSESL